MTRFRNATLAELDLILGWAADEGWNPGVEDAAAFYQADPQGFFVAVDPSDQPVAAISVVNHTPHFAFLGLYIVRPAYRGQGIGLGLWTHALAHSGVRTVGLDGVEAQQDNYKSSGFQHAGGTTRYTGTVQGFRDPEITRITPAQLPTLLDMEAQASGVEKPRYLTAWFQGSATRTTIVAQGKSGIDGFCTIRTCGSGAKIGPLVASDTKVAHRLIAHAAALGDGPVTLDVPATAAALQDHCVHLGLEPGFRTARMYNGPFAAPQHDNFAVASLELG
ncbi:GNAT family N-acetyltransferase [Epibacterium sp. SM1979]|uniref:GNAT family N-acetyltransferase n=1 Tax=Tritonibacter litoralis TaxID=2662264 RepID=A0A843YEZ2_9RHOB|nr:GNAT family N-acetyltransferase [Tritonibacter litoralis]MQQ09656.1 GNAT family N-acetyltransferase [Tritonibacter litoralis]